MQALPDLRTHAEACSKVQLISMHIWDQDAWATSRYAHCNSTANQVDPRTISTSITVPIESLIATCEATEIAGSEALAALNGYVPLRGFPNIENCKNTTIKKLYRRIR